MITRNTQRYWRLGGVDPRIIDMEQLKNKLIQGFMTKEVIFIRRDEPMSRACEKMRSHKIRHLPVLDDEDRVSGIFTDTDLNRAYKPRETESGWQYDKNELDLLILSHFMSSEPVTLYPDNTLKDAADIMARNKFGCVVIVLRETEKLAGIITYIDILKQIALPS